MRKLLGAIVAVGLAAALLIVSCKTFPNLTPKSPLPIPTPSPLVPQPEPKPEPKPKKPRLPL